MTQNIGGRRLFVNLADCDQFTKVFLSAKYFNLFFFISFLEAVTQNTKIGNFGIFAYQNCFRYEFTKVFSQQCFVLYGNPNFTSYVGLSFLLRK